MAAYHIVALLVFLVVLAALLIRYVNLIVDREFRDLARAVEDGEYRSGELARVDALLAACLPLPSRIEPMSGPLPGGVRILPPVLLAVGVILFWGGVFAREEKSIWFYAGAAAMFLAAGIVLATLGRRKMERVARLLRFRADLRRLDGDSSGAGADLRELLKITPWDDAAWAELADDLAAGGDLESALDAARQAARLDPRYDEYRMIETSLALRLGRIGQARDSLRAWTELGGVDSDDPRVTIYRAALELAEGNREAAANSLRVVFPDDEHFLEFLERDPALDGVRNLLPGGK